MKVPLSLLAVSICYLAFARSGVASPTEPATKCPISLDRLDLRYNHTGGGVRPAAKIGLRQPDRQDDYRYSTPLVDS